MPVSKAVKVHRDYHAETAKALYSLPEQWIGHTLDVRADTELVKFYHRGKLVKVHPRQPPGGPRPDRADRRRYDTAQSFRRISFMFAAICFGCIQGASEPRSGRSCALISVHDGARLRHMIGAFLDV